MKQEAVADLQEGLSKGQVRILLGPPLAQHPFKPNHWEYVYYSNSVKPLADAAKRIVIHFDEDHLVKTWQVMEKEVAIQETGFWSSLLN